MTISETVRRCFTFLILTSPLAVSSRHANSYSHLGSELPMPNCASVLQRQPAAMKRPRPAPLGTASGRSTSPSQPTPKRLPVNQPIPTSASSSHRSSSFTDTAPVAAHYNFVDLIGRDTDLARYALTASTLDFKKHPRQCTLSLTTAILKHHFQLSFTLPPNQLIPTIPNRQQYLQWAVSLLPPLLHGDTATYTLLDIGTGPSCIYPLLASRLYPNVNTVATDISKKSIEHAQRLVDLNDLSSRVTLVHNDDSGVMFPIGHDADIVVCNPPFHPSNNTGAVERYSDELDVGTHDQVFTDGGEVQFLARMARQSVLQTSVLWFTSLLGCKSSVAPVAAYLRSHAVNAAQVRTVQLSTGGRTVRWAVAWTFGVSAQSIARVQVPCSSSQSKWRVSIAVSPSRKYANQLTPSDILHVATAALEHQNWTVEVDDEDNDDKVASTDLNTASASASTRMVHVGTPCAKSNEPYSCVCLHVAPKNPARAAFEVTVKCERRAALTSTAFREVCDELARDIVSQLDD